MTRLTGAQGTPSATFQGGMRSSTLGEQIVEAAHATEQRLRTMRSAAARDADRLVTALSADATPAFNGSLADKQEGIAYSNPLLSFQPQTYAEQVRYLELVARAFDAQRLRGFRPRASGALGSRPHHTPSGA